MLQRSQPALDIDDILEATSSQLLCRLSPATAVQAVAHQRRVRVTHQLLHLRQEVCVWLLRGSRPVRCTELDRDVDCVRRVAFCELLCGAHVQETNTAVKSEVVRGAARARESEFCVGDSPFGMQLFRGGAVRGLEGGGNGCESALEVTCEQRKRGAHTVRLGWQIRFRV